MPSESSTATAARASVTSSSAFELLQGDARSRASAKGATTLRRHKKEHRAERLAQIRDQIADGTLVIRQMKITPHEKLTH